MGIEHDPVKLLWAESVPEFNEHWLVTPSLSLAMSDRTPWIRWDCRPGEAIGSVTPSVDVRCSNGDAGELFAKDTGRSVFCEQGVTRLVSRSLFVMFHVEQGFHRTVEGLREWAMYADGAVFGTVALRFPCLDEPIRLLSAGLALTWSLVSARRVVLRADGSLNTVAAPNPIAFDDSTVGLIFEDGADGRGTVLIGWRPGKAVEYVGGKGSWHRVGDGEVTPYYEDWGSLPGQGWGDSGWNAMPGAGIRQEEGEYPSSRMLFADSAEGLELPPLATFHGHLLMMRATDEAAALARLKAHLSPVPVEVTGGHYRGYAVSEGAHYVYARDATELTLTVPPADAPVAVHVYGLSHWGGWQVTCDDERIVPQLVNDGRGTDDPNGLQLGRFDDRFGPITGKTDVPANRMILVVPPGGEARTVEIKAVEGLALAYLHWDDRQMYLIQSSANPRRNLAEFHVRDGKLRRLVAPHSDQVSIAAMPMYWYQCNSPTSYYATDEVTKYVLTEAGPEAIAFEVHSRNKYGCAEAVHRVRIPFDPTFTRVEVDAELEVTKTWHFRDLQILNLFTEEFRDDRLWPHEFALAMHSGGGRMLKRPREGKRVVDGEHFSEYTPPLLFAQYTAERGNVFLAQTRMEGPVVCQHFLCPHWIDSHYHVSSPTGRLEAGDRVAGSYALVIDDGREIATAEAQAVGRAVIAGTPLPEAVRAARG